MQYVTQQGMVYVGLTVMYVTLLGEELGKHSGLKSCLHRNETREITSLS